MLGKIVLSCCFSSQISNCAKMWFKYVTIIAIAVLTAYLFNTETISGRLFHFGTLSSHDTENTRYKIQRVLVIGATGQQGRGFIEKIIHHNNKIKLHEEASGNILWEIKAITRNTESKDAQDLKAIGVDVLQGDLDTREHLDIALQGIDAVFGMTFSDFEGGKEFSQGKLLADAVKSANVKYFLFSGGEKTGLPFLDIKFEIEQYVRTLNIPFTLFFHTVFFYENLITKKGAKRVQSEEGVIHISNPLPPGLKIPMISAYDIGRIAAVAILHPENFTCDVISAEEFLDAFQKNTNLQPIYHQVPLEVFEKAAFPDMYRWYMEKGHYRDLSITKKIYPDILDLKRWMETEGAQAILEAVQLT